MLAKTSSHCGILYFQDIKLYPDVKDANFVVIIKGDAQLPLRF